VNETDYGKFMRERIAELRTQKNISGYTMSHELGKHKNYIGNIENNKSKPSIQAFFCILEYFDITPGEFFDSSNKVPSELRDFIAVFKDLNIEDQKHIKAITEKLNRHGAKASPL